jgi:hypothetical protein
LTLLLVNGNFIQIIGKPFTASAFLYLLSMYFTREVIFSLDERSRTRATNRLAATLVGFAFIYEGAVLAAAGTVVVFGVYKQWQVLRSKALMGGVAVALAGTFFLNYVFNLKFLINPFGVSFSSDLPLWTKFWMQMFSGVNFEKLYFLYFSYNHLAILSAGAASLLVASGLVLCLRKSGGKDLRFYFTVLAVACLLTLLFNFFVVNRIRPNYVLYILPLWALVIWEIGRVVAHGASELSGYFGYANKLLHSFFPVLLSGVLFNVVLDDTRVKPLILDNFTDVSRPKTNLAEGLARYDMIFTTHPMRFMAFLPFPKNSPVMVRIPVDVKTKRILPSFTRFTSSFGLSSGSDIAKYSDKCEDRQSQYGFDLPCEPDTWERRLDREVTKRRRIWLGVFKPFPERVMSRYAMTFQKAFYEMSTIVSEVKISGNSITFTDPGTIDIVATVTVNSRAAAGRYLQYSWFAEEAGESKTRTVFVRPGDNTVDILFRVLPRGVRFLNLDDDSPDISIRTVKLAGFKRGKIEVLQSTLLGRLVLRLASPFSDWDSSEAANSLAAQKLLKVPAHPHLPLIYLINPKHPGPGI